MTAQSPSWYKILEVDEYASPGVIEAAFRVLARKLHPDLHPGNTVKMGQVNEAYAVLSDPAKRAQYDSSRKALGGKLVGNYRILSQIAEGGFGKTYKAEHVILGDPACVKHCNQISPQDEAVLVNEARAMWDLRHFAIPAIRDLVRLDDGSLALVMSYIPGLTLDKVVGKIGSVDAEHVAWITQRVLNALVYLHKHGVVHGDVKPQNIIVQAEEHTVVLIDYGLSMIKPTAKSDAKGYTPYFASPEQLKGMPLLPESDLYSLGITMIYLLAGGKMDYVEKRRVPSSTPDPLCHFIKRLISPNIYDRPEWRKEDLCETIENVRQEAFGRRFSGMKPLGI